MLNNIRNNFTALLLNARSIKNKLGEIKLMMYSKKPEVVCLTETWLNNKYIPRFINYKAEWNNRIGVGGGVGILMRSDVNYLNVNLIPYANGVLEVLAVKIYLSNKKELHMLVIYNPSNKVTSEELQHYVDQLGSIHMIMGDLNAHTPILCTKIQRSNANGQALEYVLQNTNECLINPLDFYTYLNPATGKMSCLDLCLTSAQIAPITTMALDEDVGSDHRTIKIVVEIEMQRSFIIGRKKWKVTKEKMDLFKQSVTACSFMQPMSVDEFNRDITNRIKDCAIQVIGQTTGKSREGRKTPWWSTKCQKAVMERRKARKILEKHPTEQNAHIYREKSRAAKEICKRSKTEAFHKYVESIDRETPTKTVWKKIKSIKSSYSQAACPLLVNGSIITDNKEKANEMAKYIKSNGSCNHRHIIDKEDKRINEAFKEGHKEPYNEEITENEIIQAIQTAKNTAAGEDEISNEVLKNLPTEIIKELHTLFNQSFITSVIPENWKTSIIIPIPKPEKPKEEVSSYRPISLLSCLGKTMEWVL